jgi:hypothetical protein
MSESIYTPGTIVTYMDMNATVSDGGTVLVTGPVNGPVIFGPDDEPIYVPVFSQCDNGREPMTIYVAVGNIMDPVQPKET